MALERWRLLEPSRRKGGDRGFVFGDHPTHLGEQQQLPDRQQFGVDFDPIDVNLAGVGDNRWYAAARK